jgi:hypothetical protein
MKKFLLAIFLITVPLLCSAADIRPGTDDYLINNGWNEERLSTDAATEEREFFASTTGEETVKDPVGDVLSRTGTHPQINYGWGDITEAGLVKDTIRQCWSVDITVAEEIPLTVPVQVNFWFFVDGDGDQTNNAPDGIKVNTDKEFVVKNNQNSWTADYRWYNSAPNARTWATNKDTLSTFTFEKNELNICVPFTEVGQDITPIWRTALAIYNGTNTQVDVAQNTGFPPIKGERDNTTNQKNGLWPSLLDWRTLGAVGGLIVLVGLIKIVFWFVEKKKKTKIGIGN